MNRFCNLKAAVGLISISVMLPVTASAELVNYGKYGKEAAITSVDVAFWGFITYKKATDWGYEGVAPDSDLAHEMAAYEFGYEIGDPALVTVLRSLSEVGQGVSFTTIDAVVFQMSRGTQRYKYSWVPGTGGDIPDALNDIQNTRRGALDRKYGRTYNPPPWNSGADGGGQSGPSGGDDGGSDGGGGGNESESG